MIRLAIEASLADNSLTVLAFGNMDGNRGSDIHTTMAVGGDADFHDDNDEGMDAQMKLAVRLSLQASAANKTAMKKMAPSPPLLNDGSGLDARPTRKITDPTNGSTSVSVPNAFYQQNKMDTRALHNLEMARSLKLATELQSQEDKKWEEEQRHKFRSHCNHRSIRTVEREDLDNIRQLKQQKIRGHSNHRKIRTVGREELDNIRQLHQYPY